jgi:tRNA(adenine34) deaminase
MALALEEARKALAAGEVPVGAVVMRGDEVLGRGHNLRETGVDPTAHAEVLAIRDAARHLAGWRLEGTRIYATCEPCLMCMGAIYLSRIPLLVYGSADLKAGACGSVYDVPGDARLPHHVEVVAGVREAECRALLGGFFRQLRARRG